MNVAGALVSATESSAETENVTSSPQASRQVHTTTFFVEGAIADCVFFPLSEEATPLSIHVVLIRTLR